LTRQTLQQRISGHSSPKSSGGKVLFILSGESTGIPEAEAESLVSDLDPAASFSHPERGLLLAETTADPGAIAARVAFSRRVGTAVPDGEFDVKQLLLLRSGSYRVRVFGEARGPEDEREVISSIAEKVDGTVSLDNPDLEVSAFIGPRDRRRYYAITAPLSMEQEWASRRPRSRAFFHPSAIFPKLSRALVNLSGVQPGETFLDPFCGTGSLMIEASIVGADPVGIDLARKMVRGARRNSLKYGQPWVGLIRGDSRSLPITKVAGMATDIPYGRASSAGGLESSELLSATVAGASEVLAERGKLVVMHPKRLEAPQGAMWTERELDIYVHRTLTRTVTVMRKE
jgi:putative methyltransferase (TIGR01177 family)